MNTKEKGKVVATRFGNLSTEEVETIRVPNGLIGFEGYKDYLILDRDEYQPFQWLIAVDKPSLNFIVVNPLLFFPDYAPNISKTDLKDLKIDEPSKVRLLTIVTLSNSPQAATINLSGPIFINKSSKIGKQIVLTGDTYSTKHSLLKSETSQVKED